VIISGKSFSKNAVEAIKEMIAGWDFSTLGINKEWQFIIKF